MFRKQWDFLAAGKPVDVIASEPLGEITAGFQRVAKDLPPIAVEVLGDKQPQALGTIVGSDGRILTKASQLYGALSCRFADGRIRPASVQSVSREHDLAILKVDASDLPEARGTGALHAPFEDEIAVDVARTFIESLGLDHIQSYNFRRLHGREIFGVPMEAAAGRRAMAQMREAARQAGRPGIFI